MASQDQLEQGVVDLWKEAQYARARIDALAERLAALESRAAPAACPGMATRAQRCDCDASHPHKATACDERCVGRCYNALLPLGSYPRPTESPFNATWRCDGTGPAHRRCSLCACTRVVQDDGTLGACSNIECKDPLHDCRAPDPARCEATILDRAVPHTDARCNMHSGHTGEHTDGSLTWTDATTRPDPAPEGHCVAGLASHINRRHAKLPECVGWAQARPEAAPALVIPEGACLATSESLWAGAPPAAAVTREELAEALRALAANDGIDADHWDNKTEKRVGDLIARLDAEGGTRG